MVMTSPEEELRKQAATQPAVKPQTPAAPPVLPMQEQVNQGMAAQHALQMAKMQQLQATQQATMPVGTAPTGLAPMPPRPMPMPLPQEQLRAPAPQVPIPVGPIAAPAPQVPIPAGIRAPGPQGPIPAGPTKEVPGQRKQTDKKRVSLVGGPGPRLFGM